MLDQNINYPLLQTLLYDTPLMIVPSKADILHQVIQGYATGNPPEIDAASFKSNAERKPYEVTTGGVAVIRAYGSLTHRAGYLGALSGLTGYNFVSKQIELVGNDPDVKGALLDIDSPGGSVSGLFSLCEDIKRLAAVKPVWSLSNENMFSAAYAIGSSVTRILAPETAMAGSIGVIMMHLDQSKANEKAGRKYTPIYAGHHKIDGSSHAPLSDQAMETYQNIVNQQYDIFVRHVAMGRPDLSEQDVRDTEAQIYTAKDAVNAGLIDQIASYDEALEMLEAEVRPSVSFTRASARTTTEKSMSIEDKSGNASAITQADLEAAVAKAKAEGKEEGLQAGIDQERTRVTAILEHEKSGANFAQAKNAITTGLTAEQATGVLAAMPDVKPAADTGFAEIMGKLGNPAVHAGEGDDGELTDKDLVAQISQLRHGGE